MTMRIAAVAALALSCAACANQEPIQPMGLGFHGQIDSHNAPTPTGAKAKAGKTARKKTLNPQIKQTLGGKVLSAIALERVTGRKPDPSRFNELR